jgi:hypothetical protein
VHALKKFNQRAARQNVLGAGSTISWSVSLCVPGRGRQKSSQEDKVR